MSKSTEDKSIEAEVHFFVEHLDEIEAKHIGCEYGEYDE